MRRTLASTMMPPRKKRERLRRRQAFLKAAEAVFAREGFHAATMEQITAVAEYATGAIYRYFESKEVLYAAVLEQKMNEFIAFLHERTGTAADSVTSLKQSVAAHLEFAVLNRECVQTYFREPIAGTRVGEHWARVEHLMQKIIDWRTAGVIRGQEQGVFRAGNPRVFALALDGIIVSVVRDWVVQGTTLPLEETADLITELALRGVLLEPLHGASRNSAL